ncbi:TPA: DUF4189 domain-containing protein [Stenotrophomonas maltophilia]|nr:DUF4189 domain-containing protein [Stenotrophomonas maltophilia]HDS1583351.1 DUF4189 domain-containing protein [Stenotrophomonas maltophilia]
MSWRFTLLRSWRVILGLLLAAVFQSAAFAEGGCPPGQYPIGGQGVQGCAPIPGAGDGSLKTPQPGGKWIKTWGAISVSPEGASGVSTGRRSKSDAEAEAVMQCRQSGGHACRTSFSYENQCVAAVVPSSGSGGTSFGGKATVDEAIQLATRLCIRDGGQGCHVVYTACSAPEYVRK